jgi:hypothetical protein
MNVAFVFSCLARTAALSSGDTMRRSGIGVTMTLPFFERLPWRLPLLTVLPNSSSPL